MGLSTVDGDLYVRGTFRAGTVTLPNSSVGNTQINSSDPIAATKLDHQYCPVFRQAHGTAATAERRVIHVAQAAGSVAGIGVGVVVACIGDSTITVNLYKNGSTVLSAPVVLDNSNTAFAIEAGAISSASYSADDVFEVVVTVSAGTGTLGQGLFVSPMFREACG